MRAVLSSILLASIASTALARIDYTVRAVPGSDHLEFEMVIPSDGKALDVQIPNWAPGSYRLANNRQFIKDVTAVRASREVAVTQNEDGSWSVSPGSSGDVTVRYSRTTGPLTDRMHITGPAYYLYVKNRIQEDCTIQFQLPEKWRATCGLNEKGGRFVAPSYDVLADNPVTVGDFVSDYYEVEGVKHEIAYFGGDVTKVDRKKVIDYCTKITKAESAFWGGLPFEKYVWHFTVMNGADGGWGLEHLSSTTIGLAQGVGEGTVSVLCHELFHAWNVKRIRSHVLGPFDYTVLPKTGALWLLEGVTDYYADLLLYRSNIFDEEYFKRNIVSNVRSTRANAQRFVVSPYDSSYRVGEAANGQGNSAGYGVNYYNTGWLVGLCLDLEIREKTGGEKSLDDVMYALYELCKDGKPGFAEGDIRKQLVKIGGPTLGDSYDNWVMKPGELPVEAQLTKIGFELETKSETFADTGFLKVWGQDNRLVIPRPTSNREYLANDEIVEINGIKKGEDNESTKVVWEQWKKLMVPGAKLKIVILRGEERIEKEIEVKEGTSTSLSVKEMDNVTEKMKAMRKGWHVGNK
jgi:predicted metalloprotease with PDZ domain